MRSIGENLVDIYSVLVGRPRTSVRRNFILVLVELMEFAAQLDQGTCHFDAMYSEAVREYEKRCAVRAASRKKACDVDTQRMGTKGPRPQRTLPQGRPLGALLLGNARPG